MTIRCMTRQNVLKGKLIWRKNCVKVVFKFAFVYIISLKNNRIVNKRVVRVHTRLIMPRDNNSKN